MILGIGIDSVEVARFAHWHNYLPKHLLRVFSQSEIDYCLSVSAKSAERFAGRFAAREALYKAYSSWQPDHQIPFLTFCKAITIIKKNGAPMPILDSRLAPCNAFLSLTHTATTATAFAILEQINCK